MNYQDLINSIQRYGATKWDICLHWLGVEPEKIQKFTVVAPWWEPDTLPALGKAAFLSNSMSDAVKVWNITNPGSADLTYIKTGIGAPSMMDVVLALGVTDCEKVLFLGSAGALDEKLAIGDLVIPECSICGDGASRYLCDTLDTDVFGTSVQPDAQLYNIVCRAAGEICEKYAISCHTGRAFSIDTIFAQYVHLDTVLKSGCNVVEMESAAALRAAQLAGLQMAAIFIISDNTLVHKSLVCGRTEEDRIRRKFVRREVLPQILKKTFSM